jgi:hypothetical protein
VVPALVRFKNLHLSAGNLSGNPLLGFPAVKAGLRAYNQRRNGDVLEHVAPVVGGVGEQQICRRLSFS